MASQYPKNVVTKKGLALISECIATNKQLVFTRVIVGDGELTSNQDVSTMLNAISPKMELPITKAQNEGNGQFLVRATISNSKLDIGFFPKEVALFAKAEGGTEILYAYTNGGDKVGFVPDKSIPIESEIYNIRTIIGAVTNVKAIIKDETFVTVLDLREAFTDDTSSVNDADIESNSLLANLGARVSYVKKYVKKAISDAFQSDDFDDNVIRAIGKKTFEGLGVQARFSNANSWFICFGPLFFGLIIQGGTTPRPENNAATANFGITFGNTDYIVIPVGVIDANDSKWLLTVNVLKDYKSANSCTFRTSDSIAPACYYLAAGRSNI